MEMMEVMAMIRSVSMLAKNFLWVMRFRVEFNQFRTTPFVNALPPLLFPHHMKSFWLRDLILAHPHHYLPYPYHLLPFLQVLPLHALQFQFPNTPPRKVR